MDIPQYLDRARMALSEGELDLATRYFQQIINQYPNHPEALQGLKEIQIALAKKRFPPWMREIKLQWYIFAVTLGRAKQTYPNLELLYQCQPGHIRTAMAYARCAAKMERWEEAHEAYSRVLDRNATHTKALAEDADVLERLDCFHEAAERIQRLLALKPDDDQLTHRLRDMSARSYARDGIPENLQARRAAIEKEKREAPAPPEVMEELEKSLSEYERNPGNKELGVEIAAHYRKAKQYDAANATLSGILDKSPDYEPARHEQARVWQQSGDFVIAKSLYEELMEKSPGDLSLKDEYLNTSISLLEQECKKSGASKEAYNQLERLKIERDQNRITYLEGYISNHPEAFPERLELGDLFVRNGRPDDAVPILQRAVHEPSFAGKGLFLLGQCFRAKGDKALAVQQFERALDYFKDKGYSHLPSQELKSIYYFLGVVKEELGDKKGAQEAYGAVYSADINFKDVRKRYENLYTS